MNQGIMAYYRGTNALIYKLAATSCIKFALYEVLFQSQNEKTFSSSLVASTVTALVTTAMTYPLDLAHGRMAADMSKKATIAVDKSSN
jgi:ABC-type spermidine/putrescine transport system permease subunit I